jgi:hypothetical protein
MMHSSHTLANRHTLVKHIIGLFFGLLDLHLAYAYPPGMPRLRDPSQRKVMLSTRQRPQLVQAFVDRCANMGITHAEGMTDALTRWVRRPAAPGTPLPPRTAREEGDGAPAHMPPT